MKKLLLFFLLVSFLGNVVGQTTNESKRYHNLRLTYEDYVRKQKNQKTTATILLVSGIGMLFTGTLMNLAQGVVVEEEVTTIIPFIGLASSLSSIPLYISAGANKRKAAYLSLKKESVSHFQYYKSIHNSVPAIALTIGF